MASVWLVNQRQGPSLTYSSQGEFYPLHIEYSVPKHTKKSTLSTPASGLSARRSDFHLHGQIEKVAAGAPASQARVNTLTHDMAAGFEVSTRLTNPVLNRSSCLQNKQAEMVNRARQNVSRVLFTLVFSRAPDTRLSKI